MQHVKIGVRTSRLAPGLRRSVNEAAQCGVDGVEIDIRDEAPLSELTPTGIRQIRKWLDDGNLELAAARFPTRRPLTELTGLDRRIAAIQQALKTTYDLGARRLVQSGGVPQIDGSVAEDRKLIELLTPLCIWGERVGCQLILEVERLEAESARQLLAALPEGTIGLVLHTGHIVASGDSASELASDLANHWQHVIAADGYRDIASRQFIPTELGRGTVDFAEVAGVLDGAGFPGWWIVEPAGNENLNEQCMNAAGYLRHL